MSAEIAPADGTPVDAKFFAEGCVTVISRMAGYSDKPRATTSGMSILIIISTWSRSWALYEFSPS